MSMHISVIVCTRNRAHKLRNLIQSLDALKTPENLFWEALLVDNGSTDATAEECKLWTERAPRRFRYIFEGRKGKCFALNTGFRHARGQIFALTDDDCRVHEDWLSELKREFQSDPELSVLGGRVELFNREHKPKSIVTGTEREVLSDNPDAIFRPAIIGANLCMRAGVVQRVGEFDVRLGPGSRSKAAEDLDYLYRCYREGLRIIYSPKVAVYHDHGRQTDKEIEDLSFQYGVGAGAFFAKHCFRDIEIVRRCYWAVKWEWRQMFRNLFAGKSVRAQYRALFALLVGAISRLYR